MNHPRSRLDAARLRPGHATRGVSLLIAATLVAWAGLASAEIAIDGSYWQYKGVRVLLIGGWNHGHNPFIDHDTDDDRDNQGVSTPEQIADAMDELVEAGGNTLRCVLNPGMAAAIQGMDFCAKTDAGYDLERMGGAFWDRLDTFIAEARKRAIIVQIEVWDRFDLIDGSWGAWPGSPWNPKNNVNYTVQTSGLETSYGGFGNHPFLAGVPGHPEYEGASTETLLAATSTTSSGPPRR